MVTVAICDDDKEDLQKIDSLVKDWAKQDGSVDVAVYCFTSAYTLLEQVEREGSFDIFLLDILMPEMTGITLGEHLNAICREPLIIYLTSSEDFYPDAFRVYAFQYVLKPVKMSDLSQVLDKARTICDKRTQDIFSVKTTDGIVHLGIHTIVYAELSNHICHIHLSNRTVIASRYLRTRFDTFIAPLLKDPRFKKPHSSFVVNLEYAGKLTSCSLTLTTGEILPIARSYSRNFKQQYMDYALRKL